MKRIGSSALHLVGIALVLLVVLASAARAADLRVEQGWIRALPLAVPSAGYFTIRTVTPVSGSSRKRLAKSALPISGMKRSSQGMAPESNTCSVSFASMTGSRLVGRRSGPGPREVIFLAGPDLLAAK